LVCSLYPPCARRALHSFPTRRSSDLANRGDIEAGRAAGLINAVIDRLFLSHERLEAIAHDVRKVSLLPDPVGEMIDMRTLPNGLRVGRRRVPLGVIAAIFESRPNVTVDIASLCLKSGNAC